MNSEPTLSDRSAHPAKPAPNVPALAVIAILAWSTGFFMAGGPSSHRTDTDAEARTSETTGGLPVAGTISPNGKRSASQPKTSPLQALLDAMQEKDETLRRRLVAAAAEKLGPEDIQAALDTVLSRGDFESGAVLPQIVARWAEFEPRAAADYALGVKGGEGWSREDLISCVASLWAVADPAAAKAWVLALPPGKEQGAAIDGVVGALELTDPAGTLEWVKALPDRARSESLDREIYMKWAERDPLSASKYALGLPMGDEREWKMANATYELAEKDPKAAMEVLRQLPDSYEKHHLAADKLFTKWAEKDPDAAMAAALTLSDVSKRDRAIEMILSKVGLKGEAEVTRMLEKLPEGTNRTEVLGGGLALLAFQNPQAAAALALSLPAGEVRDLRLGEVVEKMPPADAIAFIEKNLSDQERKQVTQQVVEKWARDDPKTALAWMVKNPEMKTDAFNDAIYNWSRNEPESALTWVKSQPDSERKQALLSGAIMGLAFKDPLQAVELFKSLPPGESLPEVARRIAGAWSISHPEGAAAWAQQIKDQPAREAAMVRVTQAMAQTDMTTTAAWLNQLPAGRARDAAVSAYAEAVTSLDPEGAAAWANTIADVKEREKAFGDVYQQWKKTDEDAANQWITGAQDLSDDAKKRITNR